MATLLNYEDESGGGDDTSSVTICDSSSSTINSHCFNTHQPLSPTTLTSSPPYSSSPHKTATTAVCSGNTNGSTTNTVNHNKTVTVNKSLNAGGNNGDDDDAVNNDDQHGCGQNKVCNSVGHAINIGLALPSTPTQQRQQQQRSETPAKNLLLCRRFKDPSDSLRNYTSLPLFMYATSPSTHATSADGVGVAQVAVKAAEEAVANMKKNLIHGRPITKLWYNFPF